MKRAALVLIAGGILTAGFAGQATATSSNSGCPTGYSIWAVGSQDPPYHADTLVNKNNDGIVCAKPLDDRTFQFDGVTYQIYNFIDNNSATH